MFRLCVMAVCMCVGLTPLQTWAQGSQEKTEPPRKFHMAKAGEPIAGIPQDEALKIFDRHVHELYALPGTVSVSFSAEGLVVETTKPELVPTVVEGLPVFTIPPVGLGTTGTNEGSSPAVVEKQVPPAPPARYCAPGNTLDPVTGECLGKSFEPPLPEPQLLPPPPGVIVLKPGKVREQADTCPKSFEEVEGYGGWRFCVDPQNPEKIPALWSPPIAGIPYEQVLEIHGRHVEELSKLPGVESVGLGVGGIHVYTSNPDVVPKEVEGVPVIIFPARGKPLTALSHTYNTFVRPLHGGVLGAETVYGTLTGVTLAGGKPWLIFPAHFLGTCATSPPCNSSLPLNQCPHYQTLTQPLLIQPVTEGLSGSVGYAQRWTPIGSTFYSPDVAAAFMDSDVQEGNGSLAANRKVEAGTNVVSFLGTPIPELPPVGLTVRVRSGVTHEIQLQVQEVNTTVDYVINACQGGAYSFYNSQIRYSALGGATLGPGDSGSPVFDLADRLAGMINACELVYTPGIGYSCDPNQIFGTDIITTKNNLKFDAWYGTQTAKDNTIGAFHPSTHQWTLDNGNGRVDACNPTATKNKDACLGTFGSSGEQPVVGNWTGPGQYQTGTWNIGVFSPGINTWILDTNGNGTFDGCTTGDWCPILSISQSTDVAVVGNWGDSNGNGDGRTRIGLFRPSTAQWFLDLNGNGQWDGCAIDRCWTFGSSGNLPVVGDWSGTGTTKIGVFSNGTWRLDYNGNGTLDGTGDVTVVGFGGPGDQPVVGDWSATGKSKIGVFQHYNGQGLWFLDGNGSNTFTSCADDICWNFGSATDLPVVYKKSVVKAN